jgi:hypothetical protein
MKLTVPAIRAVPGPNRDDADKETKELLEAIDNLLAESMAEAPTREFEPRRRAASSSRGRVTLAPARR